MSHLVVGTAGHIDHGKSTLVQALTGIDPDRLKEEKARGITIELGFAHARLGDLTVAFVDVPGHERFVKTMLAGAGGIDCVLLIVAADESVMPQTREHFEICRLLHVAHGIVVITKSDLVDEDTRAIVRLEVRDLVAGSFLESAPVVAVSARTQEGLDQLRQTLVATAAKIRHRPSDGAVRLPIDRAFTMQGFGTVVTGTLVSGRVQSDDALVLVPGEVDVRVRGVQVHGARCDEAVAGQRAAINLSGIEVEQVARGQTLAAPASLTTTRRIDAMLDMLPGAKPLKHGARVRFHQGTSEVLGRVSIADAGVGEIKPGTSAAVRLRLESAAAVTRGDRFIVRAYSPAVTIGGGEIVDPEPPRAGVRTAAGAKRFRALAAGFAEAVQQMIADAGEMGLPLTAITARAGASPRDAAALAKSLDESGVARRVGDRLVATPVMRALSDRLLRLVAEFHRAQPLADGIPREEARERVFGRAPQAVFEQVVQELVNAKALSARERLALPGHRLELSPDEARAHEAIEKIYRRDGLAPGDAAALAIEARVPPAVAEKMTALLLRQKRLTRVDTLVFHSEVLQALKAEIQALKSAGAAATVDIATFKERFGISRKFAIPLLEWLDRERVTRRVGQTRVVI